VGKVVVVTGVPGVGKSTVVAGALEKLKARGIVYDLVNYGDVMLELMRERIGITDRDEMRRIPSEPYREIQRAAAERIAEMAELKSVLVDTHCLVKKPEGYLPGLPRWALESLGPESIVLIEAEPEEVVARRTSDVSRHRDEELLAEVEEHQHLSRAIAMAYAALVGATVKIVKNSNGKLSEAINNMVNALG
jgi:adenylate kinase